MSAYLQLGKHGDILSILPLLHHEFQTTGIKPTLVVAKSFRQIPEALDYVNTLIYDGDHQDLAGAIKFAKSRYDDVKITQVQGAKDFTFQHRHPSWQYDQWERAGMLEMWDKLPLVLPRYEFPNQIIKRVVLGDGPFIIFGDHSQSSPFFQKEELALALKEHFPQHSIARLSSIRTPHPIDLLALMDAADLIVCVDSMPLHLAKATNRPVIALVSDRPSRWQGAAWSKRFAMHCRYSDFQRRKDELIRVARRVIDGKSGLIAMPIPCNAINGYNPSIIQHGKDLLTTYRHHPARSWKTRIAIHAGCGSSDIIFPDNTNELTKEDARLFHHNGKLMLSYVMAKALPVSNQFRCVIGYGMLVQREGRWHVQNHIQPVFRDNNWSAMSKNWCPFEHDGKIHFIWGNIGGEQIVIQVDDDRVLFEHKSAEPKWDYGEIRGGAIVPYQDKLLRFFHSRTGQNLSGQHGSFQYHVGASLMESKPPFKTIAVSKYPILSGDERYVPGCFHWKPSVVIPYGAIVDGDAFNVSLGRNDSSSEIVRLEYGDLNL